MPITLYSLFEITESNNKPFQVIWEDKSMVITHNQLADIEKHYLINLYVINVIPDTNYSLITYECVALPYNYEHKQS